MHNSSSRMRVANVGCALFALLLPACGETDSEANGGASSEVLAFALTVSPVQSDGEETTTIHAGTRLAVEGTLRSQESPAGSVLVEVQELRNGRRVNLDTRVADVTAAADGRSTYQAELNGPGSPGVFVVAVSYRGAVVDERTFDVE